MDDQHRPSDAVEDDERDDKSSGARRPGRRRVQIIEHARRLFEEKGFHHTTFDDISREVGIKREGLYYYFRNTSEILIEIVRPKMEQLIERTETVLDADLQPVSKFYLAIHTHLTNQHRLALFTLLLNPADSVGLEVAQVHETLRPLRKAYEQLWLRLIEEARAAGAIDDFGDSKLVVYAILGMCNWMSRWFDPERNRDIDHIVSIFVSLSGFGLFVDGNGGSSRTLSPSCRAEIDAYIAAHPHPTDYKLESAEGI